MAKQGKNKPEWQKQEELRATRRGRRKREAPQTKSQIDFSRVDIVLRLAASDTDSKSQAYRRLRYSNDVRTYFPLFKAHGPCAKAIVDGRVLFRQVPAVVARKILSDLTGGSPQVWRQGSAQDLQEALRAYMSE